MKKIILLLMMFAMAFGAFANGMQDQATGDNGRMTITFGYWEEEIFGGKFDRENDPMIKAIENKFNVTLEPKFVSWSDYKEKYKLWAAANQLPDFFAFCPKDVTYQSWVEQGVIRALPEDLTAYPNIKKTLSRPDTEYLAQEGKFYKFPRVHTKHPHVASGAYIRKDWMEKMGLEDPETWDEFVECVRVLVNSDCDGNGKNDTTGILPKADTYWAIATLPLLPTYEQKNWVKEDGRWIPAYYSKKAIDCIKELNKLYKEGLFFKDFLLIKDFNVCIEKFAMGNTAAFLGQVDPPRMQHLKNVWDKVNPDKPFFDYVQVVEKFPFRQADGNIYNMNRDGWWASNFFRGDLSDEKMKKILEILEFMFTPEGEALWYRGFEGVDYEIIDGKYNDKRPMNADNERTPIADLYPSSMLYGGLAYWGSDRVFFNMDEINFARHEPQVVETCLKYGSFLDDECIPFPTNKKISNFGNKYLSQNGISSNAKEYMKTAIISDDPEKSWNESIHMLEREGLTDCINYVNDQVKNW